MTYHFSLICVWKLICHFKIIAKNFMDVLKVMIFSQISFISIIWWCITFMLSRLGFEDLTMLKFFQVEKINQYSYDVYVPGFGVCGFVPPYLCSRFSPHLCLRSRFCVCGFVPPYLCSRFQSSSLFTFQVCVWFCSPLPVFEVSVLTLSLSV